MASRTVLTIISMTVVEIEGISSLVSHWSQTFSLAHGLSSIFEALLKSYVIMLQRHVLSISEAIYTGINKTMIQIELDDSDSVNASFLHMLWILWENGNPANHDDDSKRRSGNEAALLAYLACLQHMLRLTRKSVLPQHAEAILTELRICIVSQPS